LALACLSGAKVTIASRNPSKCTAAAQAIQRDKQFFGEVVTMTVDTNTLAPIQDFAQAYLEIDDNNNNEPLDMLFLNAGTAFAKIKQSAFL
jgi:NAD(P)-dependent dehydrogenase (short-subunit alcohol dehydrogenase family)